MRPAILDKLFAPLTALSGIGAQLANPKLRPLVLVGDGAFQMTGAEIAHAPEYRCNPIIVLFNNTRWEMLQAFFPDAGYNGTVPWPFATLAELWGGRGFDARTPRQLRDGIRLRSFWNRRAWRVGPTDELAAG